MTGQPQRTNEIVIAAAPEQVWAELQDATRLPDWAPMVLKTTGTREAMGAVRECEVKYSLSSVASWIAVGFVQFTLIGICLVAGAPDATTGANSVTCEWRACGR